jgi:hypothetical protein
MSDFDALDVFTAGFSAQQAFTGGGVMGHRVVYTNENSNVTLLGRLRQPSGANATQSDVSSIAWALFDVEDPSTAAASDTLVVADSVFDTLQTDSIWEEDNTGYNFKHELLSTSLPNPERRYIMEYTVAWDAGGQNVIRPFELRVGEVWSS